MRLLTLKNLMILLTALLLSQAAVAVQKIAANPEETIQISASMSDANVISISGGSIESVWGTDDKVTLQANDDTGQAIFQPVSNKPFTLFIRSQAGVTYTLSVVPRDDIIGQVIIIDEFEQVGEVGSARAHNIIAYKSEVKRLLKQLELHPNQGVVKLRGFQVRTSNKKVPLWAETEILHAFSWVRGNMIIERYLITNLSDQPLRIEEREFRSLAKNIRAISLRKLELEPAETTVLYTFRSAS
jgi:type-F conjugative transfer system secretin TraK